MNEEVEEESMLPMEEPAIGGRLRLSEGHDFVLGDVLTIETMEASMVE